MDDGLLMNRPDRVGDMNGMLVVPETNANENE